MGNTQQQGSTETLTLEGLRHKFLDSDVSPLEWAGGMMVTTDPAQAKQLLLGLEDYGVEYVVVMLNLYLLIARQASEERALQPEGTGSQGEAQPATE